MKKALVIMTVIISLGMTGNALAIGMTPQVVMDPYDLSGINKVIKFEVTASGDRSWMYIPLSPIDPSDYKEITVSFDIYRIRAPLTDDDKTAEWFNWSWSNSGLLPYYGGQLEGFGYPATTFPFVGAGYTTGTSPTVFDQYVTLNLAWDFENGKISSEYAGGDVDINQTLTSSGTELNGFLISLDHLSDVLEGDIAYIDNFIITGSDIYNSNGFQDFNLGSLNGQGGWFASNEVPERATMLLFGSGLLGLVGLRRKLKK